MKPRCVACNHEDEPADRVLTFSDDKFSGAVCEDTKACAERLTEQLETMTYLEPVQEER